MKIKALVVGPIMENCYILYDEQTLEGIIVDPGDEAISILNVVDNLKLHIKYIVNTHGHADHIGANKELGLALKAKLAIHADDACMLTDPHLNLSENGYMGRPIISQPADIILHEGDIISFGNCNLKVIHTPGHTPGGICLVGEGVVMSGDSLFAGSIGRTDFPTGSMTDLISNLKAKILTLDENLTVFPDKMLKNIHITHGAVFSGHLVNVLVEKGMNRIEAYDIVQEQAMIALNTDENLFTLLKKTKVGSILNDDLEKCFDVKFYLKGVDSIYKRLGLE